MKNGLFVISLDFELIWGVFDGVNLADSEQYFYNTKSVIPKILSIFKKYEIHCTWAIVGMLFNKNKNEWNINKPKNLPSYKDLSLSAYNFANQNLREDNQELFFAKDLIQLIINSEFQEIATHTYSHYYCQEEGQTPAQFELDLQQAINMASKIGVDIKSLVFPRNQLNEEYLKICWRLGITSVRSNPNSWYWNKANSSHLITKLARTGDAYIPLGNKSYPLSDIVITDNVPLKQKASRFYRPMENNPMLRKLKLKRIKSEMLNAAKNNEIYHLWWHPHNFGNNPKESLNDLEIILSHYVKLNKIYNFQSMTMDEVSSLKLKI